MNGKRLSRTGAWGARRVLALLLATVAVAMLVSGVATGQLVPINDLFAVGQGSGDSPQSVPVEKRAEPPFVATPPAHCLAGSRQQPGIDGRVPEGSATNGLWCNVSLVGHQAR